MRFIDQSEFTLHRQTRFEHNAFGRDWALGPALTHGEKRLTINEIASAVR